MRKTIVASSHSVTSERSSRARDETCHRLLAAAVVWRSTVGAKTRAQVDGRDQPTFEACEKNIWPSALAKTPVNLFELPAR